MERNQRPDRRMVEEDSAHAAQRPGADSRPRPAEICPISDEEALATLDRIMGERAEVFRRLAQ